MTRISTFPPGSSSWCELSVSTLDENDPPRKIARKIAASAVATAPAYFNELAAPSGLNSLRIINKPAAAAYGLDKKLTGERDILIFDLGTGIREVRRRHPPPTPTSVLRVRQSLSPRSLRPPQTHSRPRRRPRSRSPCFPRGSVSTPRSPMSASRSFARTSSPTRLSSRSRRSYTTLRSTRRACTRSSPSVTQPVPRAVHREGRSNKPLLTFHSYAFSSCLHTTSLAVRLPFHVFSIIVASFKHTSFRLLNL